MSSNQRTNNLRQRAQAAEKRARKAEAVIARVRRLCELTINTSVRADAIDQARDTLKVLDEPEQPEVNQ